MIYFAVTFGFMLLIILLMSVGVIFGRNAIKGSCGGANNGECVCTEKCDKRKKRDAEQQQKETLVINTDLLKR